MDANEEKPYDWATDAEPIYTFLGIYLMIFQTLENKLEQIILMARGFENWDATQRRLSRMDNTAKVQAAARAAVDVTVFPLLSRLPDWGDRITALVERLHGERSRRNAIMHSQYLMDGVEHGFAPLRSLRTKDDRCFDQEALTRPRMDEILQQASELLFEIGIVNAQLIQALPRPPRDGPSG